MRVYLDRRPGTPWETDDGLFYQCAICGAALPSSTAKPCECRCGNLYIDPPAGRMGAEDETQVRMYREAPAPA